MDRRVCRLGSDIPPLADASGEDARIAVDAHGRAVLLKGSGDARFLADGEAFPFASETLTYHAPRSKASKAKSGRPLKKKKEHALKPGLASLVLGSQGELEPPGAPFVVRKADVLKRRAEQPLPVLGSPSPKKRRSVGPLQVARLREELETSRKAHVSTCKQIARRAGVIHKSLTRQVKIARAKAHQARSVGKNEGNMSDLASQASDLRGELDRLKQSVLRQVKEVKAESQRLTDVIPAAIRGVEAGGRAEIDALRAMLDDANARWEREHSARRVLHDKLVELRGNIRVFARVRPVLKRDGDDDAVVVNADVGEGTVKVLGRRDKIFAFDRAFGPEAAQVEVFDEVSPLVISALDGFNVCVMAYGQTGSGKTHTMMGEKADAGVAPRALAQLFAAGADRSDVFSFRVEMSVAEVYNNRLFDLLDTDEHQEVTSRALKWIQVSETREAERLIQKGQSKRAEGATLMNEHSSRSHCIIALRVSSRQLESGQETCSHMYLVDLAGSECVGVSGARGDALREAGNINKSLSALSDVLRALAERRTHVPYRNSTLTHLLQDSLGGDAKMVLIVTVNPQSRFVGETTHALGFGSGARQVERPTAVKKLVSFGSPRSESGRTPRSRGISGSSIL